MELTPDTRTPAEARPPRAVEASLPVEQLPVVDPLLFVHVTAHHDLEQQRIASGNRLRILTATEADADGVYRGFGLPLNHPDVARVAAITDALVALEHDAELGLTRSLRRSRIHPWVKAQVGLGDKQVARLLGAIGDPYWHLTEDRPRTVSELWAYSGLHVLPAPMASGDPMLVDRGSPDAPWRHVDDTPGGPGRDLLVAHEKDAGATPQTGGPGRVPHDTRVDVAGVAARRRKGQRANWSTDAKTRAYLCATSCIKQARSPYRAVYVARRAHTAVTRPEWTPGHSHNDGLRIAAKAILRDLWREAKRLHET